MSLMDSFKTECVLLEKSRVPDGEGGWTTSWVDGARFDAAITLDSSLQARVAQQEGVTSVYTVTVAPGTPLDFHDVFRRSADGKVFRVTSDSDDKRTPPVASFQFLQVSAEEWSLA